MLSAKNDASPAAPSRMSAVYGPSSRQPVNESSVCRTDEPCTPKRNSFQAVTARYSSLFERKRDDKKDWVISANLISQGMMKSGNAASSQRDFKAFVISSGKRYFPVLTTSPAASALSRAATKSSSQPGSPRLAKPVVKMKAWGRRNEPYAASSMTCTQATSWLSPSFPARSCSA